MTATPLLNRISSVDDLHQPSEGMNNAGASDSRLIVILNDNDMSIGQLVGAMSSYLSRLITSEPFHSIRDVMREVASRFPAEIELTARRAREAVRDLISGNSVFSQLGLAWLDKAGIAATLRDLIGTAAASPKAESQSKS